MLGALLVLAEGAHAAASALDIHVVSNRPELVSGGDALVEIRVRRPEDRSALRVRLGDRDVTAAFSPHGAGRLRGLVTGMRVGRNLLTATVGDGSGARPEITNHPVGGPIFTGAQIRPWGCITEAEGLGRPRDEQCSVSPDVRHYYQSAVTGLFEEYTYRAEICLDGRRPHSCITDACSGY